MAVTPEFYPFDSGPGANSYERRWRNMMTTMRSTGVVVTSSRLGQQTSGCVVKSDPGNRRVRVFQGTAWIQGHMYRLLWSNAGNKYTTLTVAPNSGAGNRIDLVVLRANYTTDTITLNIVKGPGAVPTQNSSMWDLPLASLKVPPGATQILQSNITDLRVSSNQATFAPCVVLRKSVDTTVSNGASKKIKWAVPASSSTNSINNMNMLQANQENVLIREAGLYTITCGTVWDTGTGTGLVRTTVILNRSSAPPVVGITQGGAKGTGTAGVSIPISHTTTMELLQGDILYVNATNNSGVSAKVKASGLYSPVFTVSKVGEAFGRPL